jgi:hypothetical protein
MKPKYWLYIVFLLLIIINLPGISSFQMYLITFAFVTFVLILRLYRAFKSENTKTIIIHILVSSIVFYFMFHVIQRYI